MLVHIGGVNGNDMVNGEGVSVSLFTQGCPHHCHGCFNPESWDFNGGIEVNSLDLCNTICELLIANGLQRNLSILGGEPLAPQNIALTRTVIDYVLENIEYKPRIYVWTGYTMKEIQERIRNGETGLKDIIIKTYCLIEGRYEDDKRDVTLKLRGSSNQNLIYHPLDYIKNF